jgi:hypothetical protein
MSLSRPTIQKENLAIGRNFSIDVVVKNSYTHTIQISHLPSEEILQAIPFDPTDRTVAGSISKNALRPLGEEAENALKVLSETLLSKLGAKEFIVVPAEDSLPNFTVPEDSGFARFRHCDREQFYVGTENILKEHKELTAELDTNYHFVTDEKTLMSGRGVQERYQEINAILEQTRFTSGKMTEYKDEELQGKMSRFKSEYIRPIVMLDQKGNIAGMVRVLLMGNNFAYLSDEVVNQEIVPLERFSGTSLEEQNYNRELFLLAYLMNKACKLGLADQNHLFIIAASGREKIYEQAGYEKFPLNMVAWKAVMKFGPPGPILTKAQENIKSLALPIPTKEVTVPAAKGTQNNCWYYGKYIGVGAALLGVGLFAYRLYKGSASITDVNIFKPKI